MHTRRQRVPVLLALTLLHLPSLAVSATEPASIAKLEGYSGTVAVIRASRSLTLYPGLPLFSGDIVNVRDGRAAVRYSDGSEMKLRPETRLAITVRGRERTIDVFIGRLWSRVIRSRESLTSFRTGATTAAIRGRLVRSRSPPQPNTQINRPAVSGRTVSSTLRKASSVWA